MTTDAKTTEEKPYHHGDLRRALLAAALRIIATEGVAGLTLREVARQAGVSHNAPYHHFADKAALVAALVQEGYEQFGQALHHAYVIAAGTALDRITSLGVAYVQFAMEHPHQFRLMFRPELWSEQDNLCNDYAIGKSYRGTASYDILIRALAVAQDEGVVAAGDTDALALTAWSAVHGMAVLILDGNRDIAATKEEALALARVTVEVLINGLAKRG